LSNGSISVPIGHGDEYWSKSEYHIPMEIFANLDSIDVLGMDGMEDIL
jgi:hypothetical protein